MPNYLRGSMCLFVAATILLASASASDIITTVAGNGSDGFSGDGGPATSAMMRPREVAVDASGNLYISESSSYRVRKVASTGVITTLAGNGTYGDSGDGGPATAAQLAGPFGLGVDASGNVYLADNNRIRKIAAATNTITTVAGGGSGGDGPALAADLSGARGLSVDASGNVYFATTDSCIKKLDVTTGTVSTVAGGGATLGDGGLATSANLSYPECVSVDAAGNLYIADIGNARIRKVNTSGIISTFAGTGAFGSGADNILATSSALPWMPTVSTRMATDSAGNLYFTMDNRVRKITAASGVISTFAGQSSNGFSGDGGPASSAQMAWPSGIAITASEMFIADGSNYRVRRVGPQAPSITSGPSASPNPGSVGRTILFAVAASDAGNAALSYAWSFGDGATATGSSASHAYATAGTYTCSVTVSNGSTSVSGSVSVTINESASTSTPSGEASELYLISVQIDDILEVLGEALQELEADDRTGAALLLGDALTLANQLLTSTQSVSSGQALGKKTKSIQSAIAKFKTAIEKVKAANLDPVLSVEKVVKAWIKAASTGPKIKKLLLKIPPPQGVAAEADIFFTLEELNARSAGIHDPGEVVRFRISTRGKVALPADSKIEVTDTARTFGKVSVNEVGVTQPAVNEFTVTMGPDKGVGRVAVTIGSRQVQWLLYNRGSAEATPNPNPDPDPTPTGWTLELTVIGNGTVTSSDGKINAAAPGVYTATYGELQPSASLAAIHSNSSGLVQWGGALSFNIGGIGSSNAAGLPPSTGTVKATLTFQ